ncbi:sugar-specific transcriptional regulator TrmB [Spinactinospora alkalitolerans]|uniref:Sugar-specific transcriptional regulator TrmB n=1 Tax=Spinactinospora alkalitolerans TaxID=687207 RepID=A0A852TYC7_9ACTN|nr:helix-turn-helix domain-containing protein [Spinactinospora alkalitolerans]NYE47992.1 sugar-specific transcriptional regulator TrmB [Spinactinospora alkalitolerans]
MLEELEQIGLDPKEARFYLAVLNLDRPTVAEAAQSADLTRTNGYDIAKRLARRGFITVTETGDRAGGGRRTRTVLTANDPQVLLDEWQQRKRALDALMPRLQAMRAKSSAHPRARYLEGASGIRRALFETLDWSNPLLGILSMRDLFTVPGHRAMEEYIAGRRERGLWLKVVRSPEKDLADDWHSSAVDLRETRFAPPGMVFTMTMIIGERTVAALSSRGENFAMMIESQEYADTQRNLFEVLWHTSQPDQPAGE